MVLLYHTFLVLSIPFCKKIPENFKKLSGIYTIIISRDALLRFQKKAVPDIGGLKI